MTPGLPLFFFLSYKGMEVACHLFVDIKVLLPSLLLDRKVMKGKGKTRRAPARSAEVAVSRGLASTAHSTPQGGPRTRLTAIHSR